MKTFFTLILAFVATSTLLAEYYDFQSGDLYYKFSYSSPDAVEVVSKISPWDEAWNTSDNYPGLTNVTIPSSVSYEGVIYNVIGIGYSAFYGCSSLKSITIPNNIISIGGAAFGGCSSLDTITIPMSVTNIGSYAFKETGIYNNDSNWENDVLYINDCLIEARYAISGEYAIKEKTRLIAEGAFMHREKLTSINIPNSITHISGYAFYGCSLLKHVNIPNTITSIESCAFYECSSLESITIPKNVTSINSNAFYGCSGLTSIIVENGNPTYDSRENCNALIETTTNTLILGCQNTIIPNSITSLGFSAFKDCSALTSITIPKSVTHIGGTYYYDYTFEGCVFLKENFINNSSLDAEANNYWGAEFVDREIDGLLIRNDTIIDCRPKVVSVTIPNDVTTIGDLAFYNCSSLTSITIPNSVTSIGSHAFSDCSSLTSITIPNSVTSIGNSAFSDCSSLTSITIPNSVTSIGNYAFSDCSSLTSLTIPNSVTSIGSEAFVGCTSLTSIVVESSNSTYDSRENCNAIIETATNTLIAGCQNTIIPNSITSIGYAAFCNCFSLTSVTIPNSVTSIGDFAFYYCPALTSITIPNRVTSIGNGAFGDCSSLKTVICEAIEVPELDYDVFYNMPLSEATLYVPAQSLDDYKAAEQWKDFGTILPIEELPAAVENTHNSSSIANTQKLLRNGQVYILQDGKTYTITGQRL